MAEWEPYRESFRATLLRTGAIALVVGALVSRAWGWGGLSRWPVATAVAFWPTFGGHWIELWFLNWVRPRISAARAVQVLVRIGIWFVGGVLLAVGMGLTAKALGGIRPEQGLTWWMAGVGFIAVELVAHVALQAMGRGSFYNGRG